MTLNALVRRLSALALTAACCFVAGEPRAFAQKKFLIFGDKNVTYKTFKDAAGRFEIEYPNKDWSPVPAGGSTVAILARNDHTATVVIDLTRLNEPLAPTEVRTNAEIELETLKEQQPNAKNFTSEFVEGKSGPASLIRYARVGAAGPERVLRYSVAVGLDLYHLDAVVPDTSLAKHEPVLLHMLQSFKTPAGPAGSKD
jgi:hypothetical protein